MQKQNTITSRKKSITTRPNERSFSNNIRGTKKQNKSRYSRKKSKIINTTHDFRNATIKPIVKLQIDYLTKNEIFNIEKFDAQKAIIDIYPFVKDDISIFSESIIFNEKTKPEEFLIWMLQCYQEIYPEKIVSITTNKFDDFALITYCDYAIQERSYSVSLSFLEKLKDKNIVLFQLIIEYLANLRNQLNVPFWFDNHDFENAVEYSEGMIEEINPDDEEVYLQHKYELDKYKDGIVAEIEIAIKNSSCLFDELLKKLGSYKPKNDKEGKIIKILEENLLIFNYDLNFNRFIHYSDSDMNQESWPATPFDYAIFGWELDDSIDEVAFFIQESFQNTVNEYGIIPFRYHEINNSDLKPSNFPYDYIQLLNDFEEICSLSKEL